MIGAPFFRAIPSILRLQRAEQQLEAHNSLVPVAPEIGSVVEPLPFPDVVERIMVDAIVMSSEVRRWMIDSGPADMVFDPSSLRYRLTGPNIRERLHHAVECVGERPLMESEITDSTPPIMTTAEAVERDARESARQLRNVLPDTVAEMRHARGQARRRETDPPLLTYPGAINYGSTTFDLIPNRPDDTEKVNRKAKAALWRYLADHQREDLFCIGHFTIKGGESKMGYKIMKGTQGNVHRDDEARFCLTHGELPVWDLMLAQKLMIEDSEPRFLELASRLDECPF